VKIISTIFAVIIENNKIDVLFKRGLDLIILKMFSNSSIAINYRFL
jgi:hypothetical protein